MHVNQARKTESNIVRVEAPKARLRKAPNGQTFADRRTARQRTRGDRNRAALGGW